jgi:uncharacterized SAM-binding protein YcdF (DUF218 family)
MGATASQIGRALIELLLPPGFVVLLLACGLLLLGRRPRLARVLLWAGMIALWALATPLVSDRLTRLTGSFEAFEPDRAVGAQAIVVLAGERKFAAEYEGPTVGELTLERLRLAVRIARQSGLPLMLSGGRFDVRDASSMAELMQGVVQDEFGLPVRWLERESRNTHENALRCAPILRAAGVRTVVLVTHYSHMNRAAREFTNAGMRVIPAPVDVPEFRYRDVASAVWPSARALRDSGLALHELIGLAVMAARSRD